MAIALLIQLGELSDYAAFYSSLLTSSQMNNITWKELVPLALDHEEHLLKQAIRVKALNVKRGSGPTKGSG